MRARSVHHRQRTQIARAVAHDDGDSPVDVVISDEDWQNTINIQGPVVAEQEKWDEHGSKNDRPD